MRLVNLFSLSVSLKILLGKLSFLHTIFLENKAQINKNNNRTMLFMSKQDSLPKISLILQEMKINPKSNIHPFCMKALNNIIVNKHSHVFFYIWINMRWFKMLDWKCSLWTPLMTGVLDVRYCLLVNLYIVYSSPLNNRNQTVFHGLEPTVSEEQKILLTWQCPRHVSVKN